MKNNLTKSLVLSAAILSVLLVGCSKDHSQARAKMRKNLDELIEEMYIPNYTQTDAIQFLEEGGHFIETGDPEDPKFDIPYVLPILKDLKVELGLEWQAFSKPDDKKFAEAVAAKIPLGISLTQIQERLKVLQEDCPGDILQEWGDRWFSIDFLDQEETKMLMELEAEMND